MSLFLSSGDPLLHGLHIGAHFLGDRGRCFAPGVQFKSTIPARTIVALPAGVRAGHPIGTVNAGGNLVPPGASCALLVVVSACHGLHELKEASPPEAPHP